MDFSLAVERIGFPLAVLLYENELPENLWQAITTEQCFQLLEHRKTSQAIIEKAKAKASVILTHSDFATAKEWYLASQRLTGHEFWEWHRQGYDKMKRTASTFAEWRAVCDIIQAEFDKCNYRSREYQDRHEKERHEIAQQLYPLATTQDEWEYLSHFNGPYSISFGRKDVRHHSGSLTKEQFLEVARRLLADNPTNDEIVRLGRRFPAQHPDFARMVTALALRGEADNDLHLLGKLYEELSGSPSYRTQLGTTIEKVVGSGKVEVRDGMYHFRWISDLATKCEDNDLANMLYHFVVDHADEVKPESATEMYKWIVYWSDPESETHKKFKPLIPEPKHRGRPRSKKEQIEV